MTYEYRVVEKESGRFEIQSRYAGGGWTFYTDHCTEEEALTNYVRTIRSQIVKRVIISQEIK